MKKLNLLLIVFLLGFTLFFYLGLNGLELGLPSPYNPVDASQYCSYQDCYDKCYLDSELKDLDMICPILMCQCSDKSEYYCILKDDECVKKKKPLCIKIGVNYFCNDFKLYRFKEMFGKL